MSAFRVYGVSLAACRRRAERQTNVGDMSMGQWSTKVEESAQKLFAGGGQSANKPALLSASVRARLDRNGRRDRARRGSARVQGSRHQSENRQAEAALGQVARIAA